MLSEAYGFSEEDPYAFLSYLARINGIVGNIAS
jgi:hypothetical protein